MNRVVLRDAATGRWLEFRAPRRLVTAFAPADVRDALRAIEEAVRSEGLHAAGFLSYEAAPAFDPALVTHDAGGFPLLWFGLYDAPRAGASPALPAPSTPERWTPSVSELEYRRAFDAIKRHIAAGDTYQVNYTHRLRAPFTADPWVYFTRRIATCDPDLGAYVSAGGWSACSASPELFLRVDGEHIESRPMKGTIARGRFPAEDEALAAALRASEKDRAENVMIVDMVRNDMGRVARTGSVRVPRLFDVERHATAWQMTSTVRAESAAPLAELIAAMFPAASITGAPKARSMQIIAACEPSPRRLYTGAIGYIAPGRRAQFSVAIRTIVVDHARAEAEFGVGGGIVWDSRAEAEYDECRVKARLLDATPPSFDLLETMRWTPGRGYAFRERHLRRLEASAAYFRIPLDLARVRAALADLAADLPGAPQRVRIRVARDGEVAVEAGRLDARGRPRRVAFVPVAVDSADVFLHHKTTHRAVYDAARAARPGCDDVLLVNERGEVTESTIANVVVEIGGVLCTPPRECGLLAGVRRSWLVERGWVRERVVTVADVTRSPRVYLVNSLRGVWPVEVVRAPEPALSPEPLVPAA